jgi:DNA-binding transcriptional LysR family regulator
MLVLEALLRERSVTDAARRLGIGQPAASNALARLRRLLGDELFVRDGRGMVPTAKALALERPILAALEMLRAAIEPSPVFEAATAARQFRICAGDYAAMVLLPPLVGRLRRTAPGIDLRVRFVEKDLISDLLDEGGLDLAIGVFPTAPKRFLTKPLLLERFVCVARADHPALRKRLTLERYSALPHALVTERGDDVGIVDDVLRGRRHRRRIALTIPHVGLISGILRESDLIATIGERAARASLLQSSLAIFEPPIELKPWQLSILVARRLAGDPGIVWLCSLIGEIAANA